jgi:anti-sigma regulatory factor (Ser/Thr protein kinase)
MPVDTINVVVTEDRLDVRTFDAVLRQVKNALTFRRGATKLRIAFNNIDFVDPYAMCFLWVLGTSLKEELDEVSFVIPNFHVQSYLGRMHVLQALERAGITIEERQEITYHRESGVLLEATEIDGSERNITKIVSKVESILQSEVGCAQRDVGNFCAALSELCHNVRDHSEGRGIAVVQVYKKGNGKRFVVLGVADNGRGIKASLIDRYSSSTIDSHKTAIRAALQKEFSRLPDRGYGLFRVKQIVSKYDGSLTIRSGNARLLYRDRYTFFNTASWLGTQVGISLSAP